MRKHILLKKKYAVDLTVGFTRPNTQQEIRKYYLKFTK